MIREYEFKEKILIKEMMFYHNRHQKKTHTHYRIESKMTSSKMIYGENRNVYGAKCIDRNGHRKYAIVFHIFCC